MQKEKTNQHNSTNCGYYDFAGLLIGIMGASNYAEKLRAYFEHYASDLPVENVDLMITVHQSADEIDRDLEYYSLSGKISFDEHVFAVNGDNVVYRVAGLFDDGFCSVDLAPRFSKGIKKAVVSAYHKTISPSVDRDDKEALFVASAVNYKMLWYVLAICLMKKKQAFVHSGMMANAEGGFVIAGTSGCGKTSTMMELLQRDGWKYMAEDFGVMDAEGFIWSVPKRATVYESDVKYGNPRLVKVVDNLSPYHKTRWKLAKITGNNPCYHFSSVELFGKEGTERKAPIKTVAFFSRVDKDEDLVVKTADKDDIAERITTASFREIRELYEILANIRAVAETECRSHYPTMQELHDQCFDIIRSGLKDAICIELRVPRGIEPKALAEILMSAGNGDDVL